MFKKISLYLFFSIFLITADARSLAATNDELLDIFQIKDESLRDRSFVKYIKENFEAMPAADFKAPRARLNGLMAKYEVPNRELFNYFIEAIYQQRLGNINAAINMLDKAIGLAGKNENHFLLFTFFNRLGLVQTGSGRSIEAVSSFRMANKEAILLGNPYLQVSIYVNISDIYYKNNFYNQSLFYLDQAQNIIDSKKLTEQRLQNVVYINKAENFFRMNNINSLKKYNKLLYNVKNGTYRIDSYRRRTDYYLAILRGDYKGAIKSMVSLQTDTAYKFDNRDRQNLANAYYNAGMADSAKRIVDGLLVRPELNNHPEVSIYLYELLGKIAENKGNTNEAARNFKTALQQAYDQINRRTQMGYISSEMKIDQIHGSYIEKEQKYRRERMWLIFSVIIAVLISGIIIMIYRNARQKQYYEKLLFDAKREELSFINSHEVRRHLSNILGLILVLKSSDDKQKTYQEIEKHLLDSSESLDKAIKVISEKLDD